MKYQLCIATIVISGLIATTANARVFECPQSSNFVNVGDSIASVISQCGKPQQIIHIKPKKVKNVVLWQYVTPDYQSDRLGNGFSVWFTRGMVSRIRVGSNGAFLQYLPCFNGGISQGVTMAAVKNACGAPYFREHLPANHAKQFYSHQPKVTKLIYQPRDYLPETTFVFEDSRLADSY